MNTMPTLRRSRTPDNNIEPRDLLAGIEAELAAIPAAIEAAEDDGDVTELTSLIARQRILTRQSRAAHIAVLEADVQAAERRCEEATGAVAQARDHADALDLAVAVYSVAATQHREAIFGPALQASSMAQNTLTQTRSRLMKETA